MALNMGWDMSNVENKTESEDKPTYKVTLYAGNGEVIRVWNGVETYAQQGDLISILKTKQDMLSSGHEAIAVISGTVVVEKEN